MVFGAFFFLPLKKRLSWLYYTSEIGGISWERVRVLQQAPEDPISRIFFQAEKQGKTVSLDSPQQRTGLAYEALGPQVVLYCDDQSKVAGSQST